MALVTLTRVSSQSWQQRTADGGRAVFENVSSGRDSVQVTARGYARATEEIEIVGGGGGETLYVTMKSDAPGEKQAEVPMGPPVLAPKAQKEVDKALQALPSGKLDEARKHLDEAYRLAPVHPDVNSLLGVFLTNERVDTGESVLDESSHLLSATFAGADFVERYVVAGQQAG